MKKPTLLSHQRINHLASKNERIANAKFTLPAQLIRQYDRLQLKTQVVHQALINTLAADILDNCQVVYQDDISLVLAVPTYTLANHLTHLATIIITELKTYDDSFKQLACLRVIAAPT